MAATQGLREIIGQGVSPADIKGIEAFVLPPHLKMIDHGVVAGDRASHLTSLPYQMAVAALTPEAAFDPQQSPAALPGALHAFMQQIKISPDDGLLKDYPSAWPARVIVSTASGRYERVTKAVPGDPARRCDEGDIRAKFMTVTMPLLGRGRAEDLFQRAIDGLQRRHAAGLLREIESRTTQS
jgi:2-methylcitrate dehydratase PrpD